MTNNFIKKFGKPDESDLDNYSENRQLEPHHIDKLLDESIRSDTKIKLANRDDLQPHHIDKLLEWTKDSKVDSNRIAMQGLSAQPSLNENHLDKIIRGEHMHSDWVRNQVFKHPNLTEKHIDYLMDANSANRISSHIIKQPGLQSHHIDKLINGGTQTMVTELSKSDKLQPHHIDAILDRQEDSTYNPSSNIPANNALRNRKDLTPEQMNRVNKLP